MTRVLLLHQMRLLRGDLAAVAAGLFVFQLAFTRLVPDESRIKGLGSLMDLLPPALTRMVGPELFANVTQIGMLGFGYAHPFTLLLFAVWCVRATAAGIAGEIGNGTMDLLASRPMRRDSVVAATLATVVIGLVLCGAAAWAGTAVGLATRASVPVSSFALVSSAATAVLLFVAFGAVGLAISSARRHGGGAISLTAGVLAGSFALDYLARLWEPIGWTRRLSLFSYFRPYEMVTEGLAGGDVAVLAAVAIVFSAGAFFIFGRRDV